MRQRGILRLSQPSPRREREYVRDRLRQIARPRGLGRGRNPFHRRGSAPKIRGREPQSPERQARGSLRRRADDPSQCEPLRGLEASAVIRGKRQPRHPNQQLPMSVDLTGRRRGSHRPHPPTIRYAGGVLPGAGKHRECHREPRIVRVAPPYRRAYNPGFQAPWQGWEDRRYPRL